MADRGVAARPLLIYYILLVKILAQEIGEEGGGDSVPSSVRRASNLYCLVPKTVSEQS